MHQVIYQHEIEGSLCIYLQVFDKYRSLFLVVSFLLHVHHIHKTGNSYGDWPTMVCMLYDTFDTIKFGSWYR